MKKFLILMIAAVMAIGAYAQDATRNVAGSSNFLDNWSVGLTGGVQTNLHDWNAPQGGLFGVELNKQISPIFGVTGEIGLGFNNNADWMCHKLVNDARHMTLSHGGTGIENLYTFADGRVNLMNAFCGYKGTPRVFEVEAVAGLGYGHAYNNAGDGNDALLSKLGLNANFNLGKAKAWTLTLRPAVIWNTSATGQYDSRHAVGQLTAGVVYHFKNRSNHKHHMDAYEPWIVEKTIEKTNVVEKIVEKPVTTTETQLVQTTYVVTFEFDKAELSDAAKAELDKIGQNSIVDIDAYASPEGNEKYNLGLSQRRLNVVKEYLEGRGVKVANGNFHGAADKYSNRVAIVTVK